MLNSQDIQLAVEIHAKGYKLLSWLESAMERGFISFGAAHDFTTFPAAAQAWIEEHFENIPPDARPNRQVLGQFSRYFGTYLESSFDLYETPGQRRYSDDAHCFCPMCSWLVDVPFLQPKKPTKHDKKTALVLQRKALQAIAHEEDLAVTDDDLQEMLEDPALREPLALLAYGEDLLRRLGGDSHGAASLVLWRRFAWVLAGSPKKKFTLTADMILEAEASVRERAKERASTSTST